MELRRADGVLLVPYEVFVPPMLPGLVDRACQKGSWDSDVPDVMLRSTLFVMRDWRRFRAIHTLGVGEAWARALES